MTTSTPPPAPPPASPPSRRRERLLPFVLVMAVCVAVGALIVSRERTQALGLIAREDAARVAVEAVADAERALLSEGGTYGWIEDLEAAGLLDAFVVLDGEDGRRQVATQGYRIDVLLPYVRLGPGRVGIAVRGGSHDPDAVLRTRHFAVVARPTEPGVTGTRIWYLDEQGELYLNEGVVDDLGEAQNRLPKILVTKNASLDTASMLLWQRARDVPPKHD